MFVLMIVCGSEPGAIITGTPAMNSHRSGCSAFQASNSATVRGSSLSGLRLAMAQSTPLVLGTSSEPSKDMASRRARASALNAASAR